MYYYNSICLFIIVTVVANSVPKPIHVHAARHHHTTTTAAVVVDSTSNIVQVAAIGQADLSLAIGANVQGDAIDQCGQSVTQQCLVDEGCVASADSTRHVFINPRLSITNVGSVDFVFDPPAPPSSTDDISTIWHYNTCRDVWVAASARYELFVGADSTTIPALDAFGPLAGPVSFAGTSCGSNTDSGVQMISVNCTLKLKAITECQWLDRTRVPAGIYTLRVTLQTPTGSESSLANNVATTTVIIEDGNAPSCNASTATSAFIVLIAFACICCCYCACIYASLQRATQKKRPAVDAR